MSAQVRAHPSRARIGVAIGPRWSGSVLDAEARHRLERAAELVDLDPAADGDPAVTGLITGWGGPRLDAAVLDRLPALQVVCHAAGSVRPVVTPELWSRGIRVTSAAGVNARPVVDYTVAQIVLALKNAWRLGSAGQRGQPVAGAAVPGVYGATVGLVGLGRIGRAVAERLRASGIDVLVHDPYLSPAAAGALGVQSLPLPELAERSEVLSVHAPLIEQTRGMIGADVLDRLPAGATLINTSRGAVIVTDDLVALLRRRPDVYALLDVTDPEPLPAGHPLLELPNAFVTPHIAGSQGREVALLGRHAAERMLDYLTDGRLTDEVTEADLASIA